MADGQSRFTTELLARIPYSRNIIDNVTKLNPKYEVFDDLTRRKVERLSSQSVVYGTPGAPGDTRNYGIGGIAQNMNFYEFMYANVDMNDKVRRLHEYRKMAGNTEFSDAIDEICDDCIVYNSEDSSVVQFDITGEHDRESKRELAKEWKNFVQYFQLEDRGWEYFRQFLIDGELFFENIISQNRPDYGILGTMNIPTELITPIYDNVQNDIIKGFMLRKQIKTEDGKAIEKEQLILLEPQQVCYIHSGIWNSDRTVRLPYIEAARRPFKQLSLIEDAIIIYRLVRAPERLVFKVDVGNMNVPQAEAYMKRLMHNYWSKKTFDFTGEGGVQNSYNPQSMLDAFWFPQRNGQAGTDVSSLPGGCLAMDTKIPLLDGRKLTLTEMTKEYKSGKENWIYSCDPKTGRIVPGKVDWAGVTHKSAKVMKLTFDNGETLTCTPDHKFPTINAGKCRADKLTVGDSIYSFNTKLDKLPKNKKRNSTSLIYSEEFLRKLIEVAHETKIVSIEMLDDKIEVGTLTIDKDEKYHNYHTFATCSGVMTYNSNLGQLDDLLFFQKKLYKALKIPLSRMDPNNVFSDGTSITREELKFATFVMRIQRNFAMGIKNSFITHLKLRKMWTEYDLKESDVSIKFNTPTSFGVMREQQVFAIKLENFNNLSQNEGIANSFAQRYYLGWSTEMQAENREWLRLDSTLQWELEQLRTQGPEFKDAQGAMAQASADIGGGGGGAGGAGGSQFSPEIPPDFGPGPEAAPSDEGAPAPAAAPSPAPAPTQ